MPEARRALLVGAGSMGRAWAKNLADCAEAAHVGWVDTFPGAALRAAGDLNLRLDYVGESLTDAFEAARPDFVVDVTTPDSHHDVTLTCLERGCTVLGEKPMAHSMEAAREMVAASERAGKLYMVSQSRRYDARMRAFRDLIQSAAGPPGILNSDFYIGAHFGGFRDEMQSPLLLDMAIHTFDAARFLSQSDPLAVYCDEFNPRWSWFRGNACATAVFEMTGGLRYTYRGSWCSEGHHTSWEGEWRAVGQKGTVLWNGKDAPSAEAVTDSGGFHSTFEGRVAAIADDPYPGIAGSLREFLHALNTGANPNGECHDNIKSLAMVFGAIESARKGRRLEIRA